MDAPDDTPLKQDEGASHPRWGLPAVLATLLAANLLITFLPSWSISVAVVTVAALMLIARFAGHQRADLGIQATRKSLIWAACIGIGVWLAWGVVAWAAVRLGMASALTQDQRVSGISFSAVMWSLVVVIPVSTVLLEEVGFRGVLAAEVHRMSAARHRHPMLTAGIVVSLLFGLWHIGPSLAQASATGSSGWQTVALVAGTVVFTSFSGGLFFWLRHHTQSLITPAALHGAVNAAGLLVVWSIAHGLLS